jgi:hypothetical protein
MLNPKSVETGMHKRFTNHARPLWTPRLSRIQPPNGLAMSRAAWRHERNRHAGPAGPRERAKGVGSIAC